MCRFSRSCDRLISPYGKGIGNRPFSLFPVETLIENFATCGLRPTGWPATSSRVTGRIGARSVPNLNLDAVRGDTPPFNAVSDRKHSMNTFSRSFTLSIYFYSFFLSFPSSPRNLIRVSVCLKEKRVTRGNFPVLGALFRCS